MSTDFRFNYYDVLEISDSATQHEITVAYEKAKNTYSDLNPAIKSVFSPEEIKTYRDMIEEAYAVLGQADLKQLYNRKLQVKTISAEELSVVALKKESEILFSDNRLLEKANENQTPLEQPQFDLDPALENEISRCQQWSGDFLKKVREYKKYSIEHLHQKTKVNPWYLSALENMDPTNLPAPVFVRGYILQMAKTLGLNEKEVAESYMKIYKQKLEQQPTK